MSYLCGDEYLGLFQHGARHLKPTIALSQCPSGAVTMQGNCVAAMPYNDLPRNLEQQISIARLGAILGDNLVPPFTVIISHPQSPEFEYLQALKLHDGNFRIVNWNPLSLDANCCKLYNPNLLCIYGQEVSVADLQAMIRLLVEVNGNLYGAPLVITFRSKSGLVYQGVVVA